MIKIVSNFSGNYNEDPIRFFNFEKYAHLSDDAILFIGSAPDSSIFENSSLRKFFLSTEEQTWDLDSTDNYVNHVESIYTICPPDVTKRAKRIFTFFPIDSELIPTESEKKYDVIYAGFALSSHVHEIISVITKYNYRFISFNNQTNLETNLNVGYLEKLKLISESKISIIHNLTGTGTPQLKSRPFEAAFCKSLILCKEDEWNIIDTWFEKDKEYLSFKSSDDLKEKIDMVLSNYDDYKHIIENAYNKAINNYSSKHFIEKILK